MSESDAASGDIALVTNASYVPWCAVTIRSILESGTDRPLRILVVHDGTVSADARRRLESMATPGSRIEVTAPDVELLDSLPDIGRFGRSVWLRCLLPELLPDRRRVLYLDADTLVTGPLDALLDHDLHESPIGAVSDVMPSEHWDRVVELGITEPFRYFNSGVLLMDLERLRDEKLLEWVRLICAAFGERIHYPDQDVLNLVFAGRWLPLDPAYNAQNRLFMRPALADAVVGAEVRRATLQSPTVVHFEGPGIWKPWHAVSVHPHRHRYRQMLQQTPFSDTALTGSDWSTRVINRLPEGRRWAAYAIVDRLRRQPATEIRRLTRSVLRRRDEHDQPPRDARLAIHRREDPADPLASMPSEDRRIVERCLPFTDRTVAEMASFLDRTRRELETVPASETVTVTAGRRGGDALATLLLLRAAGDDRPLHAMVAEPVPPDGFDERGVRHLLDTADTSGRVVVSGSSA